VISPEELAEVEAGERRAAELLRQNPDDSTSLMKLMILYLHHKLYLDALNTSERLQVLFPDNPELLHIKAQILVALGLTGEAAEIETEAVVQESGQ